MKNYIKCCNYINGSFRRNAQNYILPNTHITLYVRNVQLIILLNNLNENKELFYCTGNYEKSSKNKGCSIAFFQTLPSELSSISRRRLQLQRRGGGSQLFFATARTVAEILQVILVLAVAKRSCESPPHH